MASEHECLGQVCGGAGAVKLMLTLVLRPLGGLHGIGWNRREEGIWESEGEGERGYGQIIC